MKAVIQETEATIDAVVPDGAHDRLLQELIVDVWEHVRGYTGLPAFVRNPVP
jgi:hypothetical protein